MSTDDRKIAEARDRLGTQEMCEHDPIDGDPCVDLATWLGCIAGSSASVVLCATHFKEWDDEGLFYITEEMP